MPIREECINRNNQRIIVVSDPDGGAVQLRLLNRSNRLVCVIRIDNCQPLNGPRCDYLVYPCNRSAIFVEFKGANIEDGISQIENTIQQLANDVVGRTRYAIVIGSRCPMYSYEITKQQDRFRRRLDCTLRIKNRCYDCRVEEFCNS